TAKPSPHGGRAFPHARPEASAVIHLTAHQFDAAAGDAIGAAISRDYGFAAAQLFEQRHVALSQKPAVAGVTFDVGNLAACVLDGVDIATLSQCVQHALFLS